MDGRESGGGNGAPEDVVVSYSSRDRTRVLELVGRLRGAGVSVWVDYGGIDGALLWGQEIVEAIEGCKALLLIGSESSLNSPNVAREVSLASETNKPILPVFLEPAVIPRALRYQLAGIQYLALFDRDPNEAFAAVLRSLSRLGVTVAAPNPPARTTPEKPRPVTERPRPVVGGDAGQRPVTRTAPRAPTNGPRVKAANRPSSNQLKIAAGFAAGFAVVAGLVQLVPGRDGDGRTTGNVSTTTAITRAAADPTGPVSIPTPAGGASITGETPCPNADGSSPRTTSFAKAPPTCIVDGRTYVADMQTSKGLITITLDADEAPNTVNNFVVLARYHFFDTLPFHRIVPGFVVQGGSPDGSGSGNPGYRFADELPASGTYPLGSVAMANSGANTNGSQFFIVSGDASSLSRSYSRFGEVIDGIDVVQAIDKLGLPASDPDAGKPTEVVTIQSVTIKET